MDFADWKIRQRYHDLITRHRRLLWVLCFRYAFGHDDHARDLYQETLTAMWCHLPHLADDATLDAERRWIKTQARSTAAHYRRSQGPPTVPLHDNLVDEADEEMRHMQESLDELAAFLPDSDRQIVRLYCDGFRLNEIAKILSLSSDAVYQRMHRAVQRMKEANEQLHNQ